MRSEMVSGGLSILRKGMMMDRYKGEEQLTLTTNRDEYQRIWTSKKLVLGLGWSLLFLLRRMR